MTQAEYLSWFDQVVAPTEPTFRRVPPDRLDYRITEGSFYIRQMLRHQLVGLQLALKILGISVNTKSLYIG